VLWGPFKKSLNRPHHTATIKNPEFKKRASKINHAKSTIKDHQKTKQQNKKTKIIIKDPHQKVHQEITSTA